MVKKLSSNYINIEPKETRWEKGDGKADILDDNLGDSD